MAIDVLVDGRIMIAHVLTLLEVAVIAYIMIYAM